VDLREDRLRNADFTSLGDLLQARRDVDRIATDTDTLYNDVANIDPNPVLDLITRRATAIPLLSCGLDVQCRLQCCTGVGELDQQPVASKLEDAPPMPVNLAHDNRQVPADTLVGARLVARNQDTVVLDIERKNRQQLPLDTAASQARTDLGWFR
jgi:hypothetical protein